MRTFHHRRFRIRRWHCVVLSLVILLVFFINAFESKITEFSNTYLPSFAQQVTTDAICDAVETKLDELNYAYSDIAVLKFSENGTVQAIETDYVKINKLKAEITKAAQNELVKIQNSEMDIPLGSFTGLSLLSNCGPKIKLTFSLTGSFSSRLESTFENAGVNRTIHHINLIVTSKIVTASVEHQYETTFDTDFEIAQSVIAGDIPTIYGGFYTAYEE